MLLSPAAWEKTAWTLVLPFLSSPAAMELDRGSVRVSAGRDSHRAVNDRICSLFWLMFDNLEIYFYSRIVIFNVPSPPNPTCFGLLLFEASASRSFFSFSSLTNPQSRLLAHKLVMAGK